MTAPAAVGLPHGALRYRLGCRCLSCTEQWQSRRDEGRSLTTDHVAALLREYRKRGAW